MKFNWMKNSRRLSGILLAGLLFVCGCSSGNTNQSQALNSGDYAAILPYETSDMRAKHVGLISDIDVRIQVESGLMDLAKSYFDPNSVGYKSHVFLDYDELDATDGSRGLLGTLRDDNPNGLNPGSDEDFDTGNGVVKGPILVRDLYELDFYSNNHLAGIAIGLVVQDAVDDANGERVEITPEKMQQYLQVVCPKLVSYLRERFNEIGNKVPIYVAAYQLNTDETDSSKGGYIYSAYFNGSSTHYATIDEQYVLVPSTAFSELDPQMATQFTQFKNDVATVLPDNTYVTGEAKFENKKCTRLTLRVTTHGKTAGEILAVVQSIREKFSVFTSEDCEYRVIVINNSDTFAILHRPAHTTKLDVITIF